MFICFSGFFLPRLYFYPLLREQQSNTPMSHPDSVRTRDKAGPCLLSEEFSTPLARLSVQMRSSECRAVRVGDHCAEPPLSGFSEGGG